MSNLVYSCGKKRRESGTTELVHFDTHRDNPGLSELSFFHGQATEGSFSRSTLSGAVFHFLRRSVGYGRSEAFG